MAEHTSIFTAIRDDSIVGTALHNGIAAAAYEYNLPQREVKQIVSKAIQYRQDVMKRHQASIAELRNLLDRKGCYKCGKAGHVARKCNEAARCFKCRKVGHVARNCSDDAEPARSCSICFKWGHMARDCSGDGCCKCGRVGHLGRDCTEDWYFGRGGRLCYYCGMDGYMAVCSLCGKRGHLGKDCWL